MNPQTTNLSNINQFTPEQIFIVVRPKCLFILKKRSVSHYFVLGIHNFFKSSQILFVVFI